MAARNANLFNLIKLSAVLVFTGRAWQHLFWDAPFRTFFWDENLLRPIIELGNHQSWSNYVSSTTTDIFIQNLTLCFGILYGLAALSAYTYQQQKKLQKIVLFSGGIGLFLLSILLLKQKFYFAAQFFEYSIQVSIPFLLIYFHKSFIQQNMQLILKLLVAIVFISHGMYAVGYYPIPGEYIGMVISVFGLTNRAAIDFLFIAGMLDFVISILIFVPKISKYALVYAAIWGTLTAFARLVAGFEIQLFWDSIHLNLYRVLYRIPHGLLPIMLLVMNGKKNRLSSGKKC